MDCSAEGVVASSILVEVVRDGSEVSSVKGGNLVLSRARRFVNMRGRLYLLWCLWYVSTRVASSKSSEDNVSFVFTCLT